MTIKLDVTLDTTTTPPYLDVDEQDGTNHINRNSVSQTIKWKLTSNASHGTFNSPTDPSHPGFQWVGTAPDSTIFGPARLSPDGKEITMTDLNNAEATTGEWVYQLSATIGGTVYQSATTTITATTTNPSIKNN